MSNQRSGTAQSLREVRRLAELTLNQGEGEWLPYEETWYEIATGLLRAVEALEYIEGKDIEANQGEPFYTGMEPFDDGF